MLTGVAARMRRGAGGLIAVVGAVTLLVGASGANVSPVPATGATKEVLFQDPLEKPSKAIQPSSGPGNTWSFVEHKLLGRVLKTAEAGGTDYKPDFDGNELGASDLANVTIAVDVSLSSGKPSAAGPSCGDARTRDQYVLDISNKGRYALTFEYWNGGDTPTTSIPVTSGKVRTRETNHLVLKCTQAPRPGGGVQTLTGKVNGKKLKVERVTYEEGYRYLANPQVGLHVGGVGPLAEPPAAASFSNLKVSQVRSPGKTPLDWSDESRSATLDYLFGEYSRACSGFPVDTSAPYAGATHPVYISEYGLGGYENQLADSDSPPPWSQPAFAEDFQLVACVEKTQTTVGPSCGIYTRSDGVSGELRRTSYDVSVRIVVATTGEELEGTTLAGPFPDCPVESTVQGDPPWTMQGAAGLDQVLQYVAAFTTGPPR